MSITTVLAIPEFGGWKFGGVHSNVLSLATYLISRGHEAYVVDLNNPEVSPSDFIALVEEKKPSLVGVTSTSPSHLDACALAKMVKKCSEEILVVKGGKHDMFSWESTLRNHPEIDLAVVEEGELILDQLVDHLDRGASYHGIPGLAYRHNGDITLNEGSADIDYRDLPFVDRSLVPHHDVYSFDIFNGKKSTQVMTARGCPFNCNFCHVGRYYKERTTEQVIEELRHLRNAGYEAVYFDDGTFTANKKRIIAISQLMIEERLDIEWGCQTRVDRIDEELLEWMREAGCTYVFYGVESSDQTILDSLNKGLTPEQNTRGIQMTKKAGMRVALSLMVGLPHETDEQLRQSFAFAAELDPDFISLSLYAVYPPHVDGEVYETRMSVEPIYSKFDEGFGSVHCISTMRSEEIYGMALEVLGDRILR